MRSRYEYQDLVVGRGPLCPSPAVKPLRSHSWKTDYAADRRSSADGSGVNQSKWKLPMDDGLPADSMMSTSETQFLYQ